ncbi:ATP-binding protein [Trinickia acidisoli]|uniref:ATP-binding protein n=1 Tax=Trinickia acidisoli TaxID=2767482 RepID=UPI001A8CB185|nr:ATP-binding protein [Trinickia acidisoli]
MLASQETASIDSSESTIDWSRWSLAVAVALLIYWLLYKIGAVIGLPVSDLLLRKGSFDSLKARGGLVPLMLIVIALWPFVKLIDYALTKHIDFLLFSPKSSILHRLKKPANAMLWLELIQSDLQADCKELQAWALLDSDKKYWGRFWHHRKQDDEAFLSREVSGEGERDREALGWALAHYLETYEQTLAPDASSSIVSRIERGFQSFAVRFRTACLTRSLSARRLPWDVGSIGHGRDHTSVKRIAKWRPRRPTLLLLHAQDEDFHTRIKSALEDESDSYLYPVRLLVLIKGKFPDALLSMRRQTGAVTYKEFTGREWFTRQIDTRVKACGRGGGVVILQAPSGWGKTALALSWLESTRNWLRIQMEHGCRDWNAAIEKPDVYRPLLLDGWTFARASRSRSLDPSGFTSDVNVVINQLDACTRSRLDMVHHAARRESAFDTLQELLRACGERGLHRGEPVVLLLDAVDEIDFSSAPKIDDIDSLLPRKWPDGVVLLMTTRTPEGADSSRSWRRTQDRQVQHLNVELDEPDENGKRHAHDSCETKKAGDNEEFQREARKANEEDIKHYIDLRFAELERSYGEALSDARVKEALWIASEGYFIVACGLLNESGDGSDAERRANLLKALRQNYVNPYKNLPRGPAEYFDVQINDKEVCLAGRFENRGLTNGPDAVNPKPFAPALLAMLVTRKGSLRASDFLAILCAMREACEAPGSHAREAWRKLWEMSPERGPHEQPFRQGLLALRGLFYGSARDNERETAAEVPEDADHDLDFKLSFSHRWVLATANRRTENLHRRAEIREIWAALCAHQLSRHSDGRTPDPVAKYVDAYGIDHLLEAEYLAEALTLRSRLSRRWAANEYKQASSRGSDEDKTYPNLAVFSKKIAQAIEFATAHADTGNRYAEALASIAPDNLVELLNSKIYLTGLYTAVLQALLTYHALTWSQWDACATALIGSSDIVFRHDFGEAYAAVWERPGMRASVTDTIRAMAAGKTDITADDADVVAYKREIAGYALKFIWRASVPNDTGLGRFDPDIIRMYGTSKSPTDRMIASELLLAYAIGTGNDPTDAIPPSLLNSHWPYHECDILDLQYVVARDKQALPTDANVSNALRERAREHLGVDAKRRTLLQQPLVINTPALNCLLRDNAYQAQLNGAENELEQALEALRPILTDRWSSERDVAKDIVRVLLSHPLWNVTEAVTTTLSDIVASHGDNRALVEELRRDNAWRVRYGAVDVSFNIGHVDGFETFEETLLDLNARAEDDPRKEKNWRVLGLCADNFFGWIRDGAGSDTDRKAILERREIQSVVQGWVRTAEDSWLLEYVYLLFKYLNTMRLPFDAMLPSPERWSPYLAGPIPFYQCGHAEFLDRIEDNRMRELYDVV